MEKKPGHYLGTEIDEKWWKRYMREGFLARGNGKYWYDEEAFYFHRYLTKKPLVIPFDEVCDLKIGRWHAGTWAGGKWIIKFLWRHEGLSLSSGITISFDKAEVQSFVDELCEAIRCRQDECRGYAI